MTVAFVDIEDKFDRVFGFIRCDLERILTLDPGGNFAVATLVACACETLARYRYRSGEGADAFSQLLPQGPCRTIARHSITSSGMALCTRHSSRWNNLSSCCRLERASAPVDQRD